MQPMMSQLLEIDVMLHCFSEQTNVSHQHSDCGSCGCRLQIQISIPEHTPGDVVLQHNAI